MRKEIRIREMAGIARASEYVRVALPCGRGELQPETALSVTAPEGTGLPCQRRVLKQWPDGSVKWLLLDFAAQVAAGEEATYLVTAAPAEFAPSQVIHVVPGAKHWQVDTGEGSFCIDGRIFRPFVSVQRRGKDLLAIGKSACLFSLDAAAKLSPEIESIELEEEGHLHAVLRLTGRITGSAPKALRFASRLHFFAGSMGVRIEFTLHNPQAARHPGGLWDLGDPGSVLFRELSFLFALPAAASGQVRLVPEPGAPPIEVAARAGLLLYQESSGGENWRSANHRNSSGTMPFCRRGYLVESAGEKLASGSRAAPILWCGNGEDSGMAAALPHFWQEFPKAVGAAEGTLKIELFPALYPDLHELQGGEQKTHTFVVDFVAFKSDAWARVLSPLLATASPRDYRESGIFSDLPGEDDLVDLFAAPADIMDKREVLDEYGWRNFGDLYADHEAVYHRGAENFVSHYNNQYDVCAGAYRKYFATGDSRWGEIAADLAGHVRDIDIYRTDQDREEYNHGLFWHTDHYTDAGFSSHRSFSRQHLKGKNPRFCGGGPGAEHCYTTGLMLHYFQTGNQEFQQEVIDLAEWVLLALQGPQAVLAVLKRAAEYVSLWRDFRGSRRLFPLYPLTRGTGNTITACLDAYEVGGGRRFLDKADELIRGALHPADDICARKLLDAEVAWSYTVLLASVAKYLDKKRELHEMDAGFSYARASFLAYAEWMLINEYPYLDKPEILGYPNETWAAQDLRKSVIFYQASRYAAGSRRQVFLDRSKFFFKAACGALLQHETSRFARPVTLMLQNGWVGSQLAREGAIAGIPELAPIGGPFTEHSTPYLTLGSVAARIGTMFCTAARHSSIARELAWLRARI